MAYHYFVSFFWGRGKTEYGIRISGNRWISSSDQIQSYKWRCARRNTCSSLATISSMLTMPMLWALATAAMLAAPLTPNDLFPLFSVSSFCFAFPLFFFPCHDSPYCCGIPVMQNVSFSFPRFFSSLVVFFLFLFTLFSHSSFLFFHIHRRTQRGVEKEKRK